MAGIGKIRGLIHLYRQSAQIKVAIPEESYEKFSSSVQYFNGCLFGRLPSREQLYVAEHRRHGVP